MPAPPGRDAGIGDTNTDDKGFGPGGSKGRNNRDGGQSKSKNSTAKAKNAEAIGARTANPQPSGLQQALDDYRGGTTGAGGFFSDFFGIRQSVQMNPNTGKYDVRNYKEINPIETVLGMGANQIAGPLGSVALDAALGAVGFEDPLGFEIDLGFGSETKERTSKGRDQREDAGDKAVRAESGLTAAQATGEAGNAESAIDKAVKEILEGQKKFSFFDMPQFKLLDPDFKSPEDISLAELLLGAADEETA